MANIIEKIIDGGRQLGNRVSNYYFSGIGAEINYHLAESASLIIATGIFFTLAIKSLSEQDIDSARFHTSMFVASFGALPIAGHFQTPRVG